jgi:hypothetical protein
LGSERIGAVLFAGVVLTLAGAAAVAQQDPGTVEQCTDLDPEDGQPDPFCGGSTGPIKKKLEDVSAELQLPLPLGPPATAGTSVSPAGDLNGDGISDVLSGAPASRVGETLVEAGGVGVYLGSTSEPELEAVDIIFRGEAAHDRAGVSVAGNFDFDGDGIADILIGAEQVNRSGPPEPACDVDEPCGNGVVYLIFFKPAEYPNLGNPALTDVVDLSEVGGGGSISGVKFVGQELGDRAGFAVAAGGRVDAGIGQDILIGAPGADPGVPARQDAGRAYLIFDDASLDQSTVSLDQVAGTVGGVTYEGEAVLDGLGSAVAFPGDVLGDDDLDDVALGAPFADPAPAGGGPLPDAGTVYVAMGGGMVSAIIESCEIGGGGSVAGARIIGDQAGMLLGSSVADGGDNLVDGEGDLLVGAPRYDSTGRIDSGMVAQTTGPIAVGSIIESCEIGGGGGAVASGVVYVGQAENDRLGSSVSGAGDVTRDGRDDVALGAPYSDPSIAGGQIRIDAGTLYVSGGFEALPENFGTFSAGTIGDDIAGLQLIGEQHGEHAATSVAEGQDANADGQRDLLVGAPDKTVASVEEAGATYVVLDAVVSTSPLCGGNGCSIVDLATGAMLQVPAAALGAPATFTVEGILEPLNVPAVPAGDVLLGAAAFGSEGRTFPVPVTVWVPLRPELELQFDVGDPLDLMYRAGTAWVDSGVDGTVQPSPVKLGRLVVQASVDVLHLYATMAADDDGDGYADSADCAALDPDLWGVPGLVRQMALGHTGGTTGTTTISWIVPGMPGGKAVPFYDVVRTPDPQNLTTAADCILVDGGTVAIDATPVPSGEVVYYLVRAQNVCGEGSTGQDSNGVPRSVKGCP